MNFIDCIKLLVLLTTQIPILSTLPTTSSLDISTSTATTSTAATSTGTDSANADSTASVTTEESCQREIKKLEGGVGIVTNNVYGSSVHCSNGKLVTFVNDNAPVEYTMLKPYKASKA